MTERDFAYWLQGFAELNDGPPSAEQWEAIKDHLKAVFNKVTPNLAQRSQCAQAGLLSSAALNC